MDTGKIQLCIDALAADVGDMLAKESGVSTTEALQLKAEQSGDWQRWKEE
jgi:hypothetical protein